MHAYVTSLIRTYVPVWVGIGLTWLASRLGIVLDDDLSAGAAVVSVGLVIAVYYALARAAEERWPGLGRLLLALGLAKGSPVYRDAAAPQSPGSFLPRR